MNIFFILAFVLLIFFILLFFIFMSKNKIKKISIKITEADNNIDLYLEKKEKLLKRSKELVKKDNYLADFSEFAAQELNHIEKHDMLKEYYQQFIEQFEEIEEKEEPQLRGLFQELKDNDSNLYGSIKFYNKSVQDYYHLAQTFPTKMVRLFCGFQKFELYEIEKTNKKIY